MAFRPITSDPANTTGQVPAISMAQDTTTQSPGFRMLQQTQTPLPSAPTTQSDTAQPLTLTGMAGSAFNYIKNNFPSIAKRALDVVSPSLGTATSLISQDGGQALSDVNNIPQNIINNGKQAFSTMATGLNNGVTATNPASLIAGSMKLGYGGAQLVGSIPMSILQPALTLSGLPKAMESASNFGTDNPTYQNFAQSNIGTGASSLVDFINDSAGVFGTVAGFDKGGEIYNTVKPLAQDVLPPPGGGGSIQLSTPDTQFASHLNKAFNLNKKEIGQGDSLVSNAKKVFSDISANKDTNGILDTHGNIKEPTQYSYQDTLDATKTRMPEVYKSYTSQLNGIDREKFDASIQDSISNQKSALDSKIAQENSLPDRNAMTRLSEEIGSLRDTSPIGMQDYLQKLGVRSKPVAGVMTPENIQTSNLAGVIRDALDKAATEVGNTSYSADRSLYAAYKSVQDMFLRGAVKEIKNTPGMGERLANMGITVEGLQFILTHDPHSLVIAAGLKGASKFASFLNSPLRSLTKLYQSVENQSSSRPLPLIPDITSQSAPTINSNSIIPHDNTIQTPKGTTMEMGTYKFAPNPSTGRAELTGQYRPPNVNFYPSKKTVPISNNTNTPRSVIPKDLQHLAKEVQKYSSAEEFVKAQDLIHRGDTTAIPFNKMDTISSFNPAEKESLSAFANTPGLYFTTDESNALSYGKNLTSVGIKSDANILDTKVALDRKTVDSILKSNPQLNDALSNFSENKSEAYTQMIDSVMSEKDPVERLKAIWADGQFSNKDFVATMKNQGIDGIKVYKDGHEHYVIYNKDAVQTKSQLTDFYNKVKGK